jgi:hypothetical protein
MMQLCQIKETKIGFWQISILLGYAVMSLSDCFPLFHRNWRCYRPLNTKVLSFFKTSGTNFPMWKPFRLSCFWHGNSAHSEHSQLPNIWLWIKQSLGWNSIITRLWSFSSIVLCYSAHWIVHGVILLHVQSTVANTAVK